MKALLVFVAMVAVDFCWTKYIVAAGERKAIAAGVWSALIIVGGGFSVLSYTESPWYMIPAALRAFVGTALPLWRKK